MSRHRSHLHSRKKKNNNRVFTLVLVNGGVSRVHRKKKKTEQVRYCNVSLGISQLRITAEDVAQFVGPCE